MRKLVLSLLVSGLVVVMPLTARAADCTSPAAANVDWQRCYMDERDFANVDLTGARLRETSFQRSILDQARMSGSDAYRARFISARLRGVSLDGALLAEADFTKADLSKASLVGADLRRAKFFRANLRGADLTGARTDAADFLNADLSGAVWSDGKHVCAEGSLGQCN